MNDFLVDLYIAINELLDDFFPHTVVTNNVD